MNKHPLQNLVIANLVAARETHWRAVMDIEKTLIEMGALRPHERWALKSQERRDYWLLVDQEVIYK